MKLLGYLVAITLMIVANHSVAEEIRPGVYRTADARFADLPGYKFEPNYTEIAGYRVHFLDEGPKDGDPILLLHGEPTWAYLYRKMIPILTNAGFARVVISNTGLPDGSTPLSPAFMNWKKINQGMIDRGDIPTGMMLANQHEDPSLAHPYDAPFPTPAYKAGPLIMPQRVPVTLDDPARDANLAAWRVFEMWEKPFLTAFGDSDPVTRGWGEAFRQRVPGAKGQPHVTIEGAGHFIQETHGEQLALLIDSFIRDTQ